jgi:magnesium-transporting ATPase (P-type)
MQNTLKAVTKSVIKELNASEVKTVMATGDNVLTAIHVGRECGIINPENDVIYGDAFTIDGEEKVIWK